MTLIHYDIHCDTDSPSIEVIDYIMISKYFLDYLHTHK